MLHGKTLWQMPKRKEFQTKITRGIEMTEEEYKNKMEEIQNAFQMASDETIKLFEASVKIGHLEELLRQKSDLIENMEKELNEWKGRKNFLDIKVQRLEIEVRELEIELMRRDTVN